MWQRSVMGRVDHSYNKVAAGAESLPVRPGCLRRLDSEAWITSGRRPHASPTPGACLETPRSLRLGRSLELQPKGQPLPRPSLPRHPNWLLIIQLELDVSARVSGARTGSRRLGSCACALCESRSVWACGGGGAVSPARARGRRPSCGRCTRAVETRRSRLPPGRCLK